MIERDDTFIPEHSIDRWQPISRRAIQGGKSTRHIGLAESFLKRKGFAILDRNYGGRIDLVAQDGDTIVFVAVRTHHTTRIKEAFANVADEYMRENNLDAPTRFDLVVVSLGGGCMFDRSKGPRVEHMEGV